MVCGSFGISRKTGYKSFGRYKQDGIDALCDRSRQPVRYANRLPGQVERLIVDHARPRMVAQYVHPPLFRLLHFRCESCRSK